MARDSLVSVVSNDVLERIVSGELPPGTMLPSEAVIGTQFDVSRLTVREALKQLAAINVLTAVRGRGTYVNDVSQWTSIDAVVRAASSSGRAHEVSIQMLEMRRIIEVGAAELAGARRTEDDVAALREHLDRMRESHAASDVDGFVQADLAFHDVILAASGNLLVPAVYDPVRRLLSQTRRETSAVPAIQVNAIAMHENILAAMADSDPERTRAAMAEHMQQTLDDLHAFVIADT
ncbi:GntR family transcriptional regulator [Rhodococcus sp. Leaf278]|uniref:FadR/GntR family transcriptional regulator n=1 Tax=Rhodococcus sp. Leaf278 TaxID=1736319 RepID=UPI00070C5EED|nr:FadR/GntR family transcriptional regulator [Rhodococcus sp. Leaf278]KQU49544.1 GntR family transcriptional regulator [Rhodococcus sp. Leaf278]